MTAIDGLPSFERVPPLPGGSNFFNYIGTESKFKKFVHDEYKDEAGFEVGLSNTELSDAHRLYMADIKHAEEEVKPSPSHFTRAGFLADRLSRCNPVADWSIYDPDKEKARDFLDNYGHVYLAFGLGYGVCLYFEREIDRGTASNQAADNQADRRPLPRLDSNYLRAVCYLMKNGHISSHAMGFIYRSLFL